MTSLTKQTKKKTKETQCGGGQNLSPDDFTENLPKNLILKRFLDFGFADKGL